MESLTEEQKALRAEVSLLRESSTEAALMAQKVSELDHASEIAMESQRREASLIEEYNRERNCYEERILKLTSMTDCDAASEKMHGISPHLDEKCNSSITGNFKIKSLEPVEPLILDFVTELESSWTELITLRNLVGEHAYLESSTASALTEKEAALKELSDLRDRFDILMAFLGRVQRQLQIDDFAANGQNDNFDTILEAVVNKDGELHDLREEISRLQSNLNAYQALSVPPLTIPPFPLTRLITREDS